MENNGVRSGQLNLTRDNINPLKAKKSEQTMKVKAGLDDNIPKQYHPHVDCCKILVSRSARREPHEQLPGRRGLVLYNATVHLKAVLRRSASAGRHRYSYLRTYSTTMMRHVRVCMHHRRRRRTLERQQQQQQQTLVVIPNRIRTLQLIAYPTPFQTVLNIASVNAQ